MKRYVIFGAGLIGRECAKFIGYEEIECFIDNDASKVGNEIDGIKVCDIDYARKYLLDECELVIAVSEQYKDSIEKQLAELEIYNYVYISELRFVLTREKILSSVDQTTIYKRAIEWIIKYSLKDEGIVNTSENRKSYPEVTGYYIPTLLKWGYKDLAVTYAKWLCDIQYESGAWYDTNNVQPYIFDSAQILKGLIAIRDIYPKVDESIIRGCDWILSQMTDEGRLVAPGKTIWEDKVVSELIHTYCISPIFEAGRIFDRDDYLEKASKIADYYINNYRNDILNFNLLSHFYAYVVEAMLDIGEDDLARQAMKNLEKYQKESGAVPGYNNVDWVCSTGLFQFAVIWFRLGEYDRGKRAFEYACKLQNASGGWYGSYLSEENRNESNTYIPNGEISWAVKYFLDALYYKNVALSNLKGKDFIEEID